VPSTPGKPLGGAVDDDPTAVELRSAPPRESDEITLATPPPISSASRYPDLAPGTTLGEYRIDRRVAEGGMGVVYAATHPLIGKLAAVKVLRKELCDDPLSLERFVDEARVVNQIGHPNIVDVFAFGTLPDGRSYFVMEWLKGQTLRARAANQTLNQREACTILRSLARALEAAHEQGVIHRDLKPDNVFLVDVRGELPSVKLLDFGIAKLVREDHQVARTATGAMVGTPQYVAPEQAKGREIDHRVDVYSLGCVAFELLTGRTPFIADNAMEMVAMHLMEPPPHPRKLASRIHGDLDQLIVRMLAKDRDERPSLAEISLVLDRASRAPALRTGPLVARSDEDKLATAVTLPHDVPWHVRRRIALVVLAPIAMAGIAFAIVRSLSSNDGTAPAVQVPMPAPAPTTTAVPATAAAPAVVPPLPHPSAPTATAAATPTAAAPTPAPTKLPPTAKQRSATRAASPSRDVHRGAAATVEPRDAQRAASRPPAPPAAAGSDNENALLPPGSKP